MHMMDLKAAITLFDHYVSMLELGQVLLGKARDLAKGHPELAEHVRSQIESLRASFRNYSVFSIMFSRKLVKQSGFVLLSDDFGDVMAAQNRLLAKLSEVRQFLEKVEQEESPKPTSAASSGS